MMLQINCDTDDVEQNNSVITHVCYTSTYYCVINSQCFDTVGWTFGADTMSIKQKTTKPLGFPYPLGFLYPVVL